METSNFQELLQNLEGFKIKFRELHWNSTTLAEHKLCDSIMQSISEFQDEIAESGFGFGFTKFENDLFFPIQQYGNNCMEILELMDSMLITNKYLFALNDQFNDFISIIDSFSLEIKKFKYLSTLK